MHARLVQRENTVDLSRGRVVFSAHLCLIRNWFDASRRLSAFRNAARLLLGPAKIVASTCHTVSSSPLKKAVQSEMMPPFSTAKINKADALHVMPRCSDEMKCSSIQG